MTRSQESWAPSAGLACQLVVFLVTCAVFAPSLGGELVYDDLFVVAANPLLGTFELRALLTEPHFAFLDAEDAARIGYWRPLSSLVLSAVVALAGRDPVGLHALSVLLHAGVAVALLSLFRLLGLRPLPATLGALLFAVHPVHVESVAWISALNDPLFGLLSVLAITSFVRWRRAGSAGVPWASATWFALGLLAKELAVVVLPLLWISDLARGERRTGQVRTWTPFVAVFLLYALARGLVFEDPFGGFGRTTTELEVGGGRAVLLAVELFGGALELLLWPVRLTLFHAVRPQPDLAEPRFWIRLVLAALWGASVVLAARRRRREQLAVLLLLPATLLPVLVRLRALGAFPLAERFLYLTALAPALGLALLCERERARRLLPLAASLVIALWTTRTVLRIDDWRDEPTLFASALEAEPLSPYVAWGAGRARLDRFRATSSVDDLVAAGRAFERAEELVLRERGGEHRIHATEHDELQALLGAAWVALYREQGSERPELEPVRRRFEGLVRMDPTSEDALVGLGATLYHEGALEQAREAFERALEVAPQSPQAHFNLARVHEERGDLERALDHYLASHRARPDRLAEVLALARVSASLAAPETDAWLERARALAPGEPELGLIEGVAHANAGRLEDARAVLDRTVDEHPEYGPAWLQRGNVALAQERVADARVDFERAVELLPGRVEASYNLGVLLWSDGDRGRARELLAEAYASAGPGELVEVLAEVFATDPAGLRALCRVDLARDALEPASGWLGLARRLGPADPDLALLEVELTYALRPSEGLDRLRRLRAAHPENLDQLDALERELRTRRR